MVKFSLSFVALAAAALSKAAAHSDAELTIDWILPYVDVKETTAHVGDTITFAWNSGFHNVFIHPSMDCGLEGAIEVGADPSGTTYTFTEDDAGKDIFFSCDVGRGGHCRAGQFMTVSVEATANDNDSIYGIASSSDGFRALSSMVDLAGLDGALSDDGALTVFAPTDDAFAKLPAALVAKLTRPEWRPQLTDVLLHHVVEGKVLSSDLKDGMTAPTLNAEDVTVSLDPPAVTGAANDSPSNILVDDGLVDVMASNGVIHAIDSVLAPTSLTSNIVDIAAGNDMFSTLVAAVKAGGLADALMGEGPLTVFAPTNAAFDALPAGTVEDLLKPENKDMLVSVLQYHVVGANAHSSGLSSGDVPSLMGESLAVAVSDGGVTVNGANVITADVIASNGIIHVVDAVLLPPAEEEEEEPAVEEPALEEPAVEEPISVGPQEQFIDWILPYVDAKEATMNVGDTITFAWNSGFHNVFIHPSMDCGLDGAIDVGADPAGTSYTFVESDAGKDIFFSCDVGNGGHCRAGQFMTVSVAAEIPEWYDAEADAETESIYDIASSAEGFATLASVVDLAGLGDALSGGELTVFAPSDDAFAKLPEDLVTKLTDPAWKPQLTDVLLHHVVEGTVLSADLEDGMTAPTLNAEEVTISLDPPAVKGATNESPCNILVDAGLVDVMASNGVIHAIGSVLTPTSLTSNIVDIAAGNDMFSTLVAAVKAGGLADALMGEGPLTVFAPTNAAFEALPAGTVEDLLKPENKDKLVSILQYHVVAANAHSSGLSSGDVETLMGDSVAVAVSDGGVTVNGANVVKADVIANNGIIHVIDAVLLPPAKDEEKPATEKEDDAEEEKDDVEVETDAESSEETADSGSSEETADSGAFGHGMAVAVAAVTVGVALLA